jgi:hypothetical protein
MEFYCIVRETCPSAIRRIGEAEAWLLSFLTLALDEVRALLRLF